MAKADLEYTVSIEERKAYEDYSKYAQAMARRSIWTVYLLGVLVIVETIKLGIALDF